MLNNEENKKIPENGACIFINKPTVEVILFKKITHKKKDLIITLKDGKLCIMKVINQDKVLEKEQFFKEYLIF